MRAYPRKRLRASARALVLSHQAMARTPSAHAGFRQGIPARERIDGNRVSAPVLEMREGSGAHQHQAFRVSAPMGFISRVWLCVPDVDKRAAQSRSRSSWRKWKRPAQHTAMQLSACD